MQKRLRFPRSRRLTLDSEFQRVRTEGASIRGETLTLGVLKNAEPKAPARAGFITSRRVGASRRPQSHPPAFARDFSQTSTRNLRRSLDRDHRVGASGARDIPCAWKMSGCVWRGELLSLPPDAHARSHSHSRLSDNDFTGAFVPRRSEFRLPFFAHVFRIFLARGRRARHLARELSRNEAPAAMSSLGWQRI